MDQQPQPREERRHTQEHYDGEERRKQDHDYQQPVGDEPSQAPAMKDDEQPL